MYKHSRSLQDEKENLIYIMCSNLILNYFKGNKEIIMEDIRTPIFIKRNAICLAPFLGKSDLDVYVHVLL
jgi:hypothetical protein